jgi:hypothetical protein
LAGVSGFSAAKFNQVLILKINLIDPAVAYKAAITASAGSQTSDRKVTINFSGANQLTLPNPKASFDNRAFLAVTAAGARSPYTLNLTFVSMNTSSLVFYASFSNY